LSLRLELARLWVTWGHLVLLLGLAVRGLHLAGYLLRRNTLRALRTRL
jgi:hypothetical protein